MSKSTPVLLPATRRLLADVGENLHLARLRRGYSAELVSQRAGMTRPTLRAIERGAPSVAIGAYVSVLQALGLVNDIAALGRDDVLGRKLEDAQLLSARRPSAQRTGSRVARRSDE